MDRLLTKKMVKDITTLSDAAIVQFIVAGQFPKAVYLDARNPRWSANEIEQWVERQKEIRATPEVLKQRAQLQEARRRGGVNRQLKVGG